MRMDVFSNCDLNVSRGGTGQVHEHHAVATDR